MSIPKISDYEQQEKIGAGSYATVYKSMKKDTKEIVAIKWVQKSSLSKSAIDNIVSEIGLLKKLNHKHIVEMKDFMWDEKHIYIVMEYCNAGSLSSYIKLRKCLSESTCRLFLKQLAAAIKYMRENDVSHFDLKPHNLLLKRCGSNVILKVGDFGFAQKLQLGQENTTFKGSPLYMAPEIFLKTSYNASADLWSIGVIFYECLFGKAPYSSQTLEELLEKIKNNQKIEIPRHAKISIECEDLLSRLLKRDPCERISFEDFFNHEFLDLNRSSLSDENFKKAVKLVNKAIEQDQKQNFNEAYHLYCEALQNFVPILQSESDPIRKDTLRERIKSYLARAEELKQHSNNQKQPSTSKISVESALIPSQNYQKLYSTSTCSPEIKNALEIGRQAELYLYEKRLDVALDNFKSALTLLMPLLTQEPKGDRRDLLHEIIKGWMQEAESIKSLLSAQSINAESENEANSHHSCCIQ